jgi:predicted nucleic acid-binding protein
LATSRLTRLECRTKPLRSNDVATLAQFDVFFGGVELVLAEVSAAVVERATDLRARYNLKTPDALHYATAVEVGATVFLTGDRALARCSEVPVQVLWTGRPGKRPNQALQQTGPANKGQSGNSVGPAGAGC